MIEGLHADVPSAELRELCLSQALFHDGRAEFYTEHAAAMKKLAEATSAVGGQPSLQQYSGRSPNWEDMANKAREHSSAARHLRFLAEHLVPTEVYRLGHSDLAKLGIIR